MHPPHTHTYPQYRSEWVTWRAVLNMHTYTYEPGQNGQTGVKGMSWTVGIQHPGAFNYTYLSGLEENLTFVQGLDRLLKAAQERADVLNKTDAYLTLISDIELIRNDQGITDDPDQWEDMDFNGPFDDTWYITED